jgi:hypothetical protein
MLSKHSRQELFAVLAAWRSLRQTGWPDLLPALAARAHLWPTMDEAALHSEIERLLSESSAAKVRVFWKLSPDLRYGGFNPIFFADSAVSAPESLLGQTDLIPTIGWSRQAAKYRADDFAVMAQVEGVKDIVERQDQPGATVWVHTAKMTLRTAGGEVFGVLGMYEVIDAAKAAQLERRKR